MPETQSPAVRSGVINDRTAARSLPTLLRARAADAAVAMHDPQLARLVLTFGAWITAQLAFLIVVSVIAYDKGGAAAVGLTGAVRVLPAAVLGPLVAVALDRLPRPRVLAGVHLSWLLVALATAWLAATDAPLGSVLVVLGLGSVTLSVFKPYVHAMIPQVVTSPSQLIVANSACSTIEAVGTVLGPVLTGLLLATFDPAVALLVLALVFALGAAAASGIRTEFQPPRRGSAGSRSVLLEPLRGFQVLVAQPGTRTVYGLFMLQTLMRGLVNVFVVVLALRTFDGGEAAAGNLFAAVGVGGLIGVLVTLGGGAVNRSALWFAFGISLWGVPIAVIGVWPDPIVALCAFAALGAGNAVADVYGFSLLNRLIPDHLAGRAWGVFHSSAELMIAVGSIAAPLLITAFGLPWALGLTGAVLALSPLVLWQQLRTVDAATAASPDVVELLRQVPTFAPMTGIGLERLARSAREMDLPDNDAVIREGDVGDLFYVVVEGRLSVSQAGRERRMLGPGDAFGEIALLKAVPRTASVTSIGSSRVLTIDGDSFVAAVTGQCRAEHLAHDAADDLLRGDDRSSLA